MKIINGLCILLTATMFNSCSKNDKDNDNDTPTQEEIIISTMNPTSGPYSTIVTLTGSGFNSTASENIVKFNGKTATVQSATSTQLVVVVPEAAGTGNVTVTWGNRTETGPVFNFIYTITVSTFSGNGIAGFQDGNSANTQFDSPFDLDFDSQGNLYVADYGNNRIRKITPAGVSSTFAGSGGIGTTDGNGSTAEFHGPSGLDVDINGNVLVADQLNNRLRKITPAGVVSTIAGSIGGYADGNGTAAQFYSITDIVSDANGNIFATDQFNHRIRKISPAAVVSTLAGSGVSGFINGNGISASFYNPGSIIMDNENNLYISEYHNNCIRKMTPAADVTTYAGNGVAGSTDGDTSIAQFTGPWGLAMGNDGTIYIAELGNHRIRQITPSGMISTIAGSTEGFADGSGSTAKFASPSAIAVDASGNLFVAEAGNNRIRKITIQ